MCSRHQPEHGADSAEANLESAAEMLAVEMATAGYADPDSVEQWRAPIESARSILKALERRGYTLTHWQRPQCAACSPPAVKDGYCTGHARLGEYRTTDEKHWAANE